ncbi:hypothetical protein HDE_02701 [Halotydeus destructor]|nr:hypothetical protein HDE_02701 [Halotydeus destructor]
MTSYAHRLVVGVLPTDPEPLRLPRRIAGDVFLNKGYVLGLNGMFLDEEPTTMVCFNETIGAIQPKFKANGVSVVYEWIYGDNESWGRSTLAGQDIWIDLDIERDMQSSAPELLALYVTEPVNNDFEVKILGGKDHSDSEAFMFHVKMMTRMAFQRDLRLALTYDFGPRIEEYLEKNTFSIY